MRDTQWEKIWESFHFLWGRAKDKIYDKSAWSDLQAKLRNIEECKGEDGVKYVIMKDRRKQNRRST